MKLVVGLGNPGRKYAGTRHNVGFSVAAELARRHGLAPPKHSFQGELVEADLDGQRTLLLCPHTYMNLSGGSVLAARDFYKLPVDDLLVVCDDFNLPLGKVRLRAKGTAGGQQGLADVIRRLGTEELARLRIGVGLPPPRFEPTDWVLSKFTRKEIPEIELAIATAADAVVAWAVEGTEFAMNAFN